jgi:glycosyltransferase involved in cell wall biosynthesis
MKILIITQAIDRQDTALGFFHRWVEEISIGVESVDVICLKKGDFNLPKNVKVFSLGKESQISKLSYVLNFYKYIWSLKGDYDAVFVHMNQEYVLLGGLVWKILGKKVFFWRNHLYGDLFTKFAVALSDKVFYTSEGSFTAKYKKSEMMPAGVDTEIFTKYEIPRVAEQSSLRGTRNTADERRKKNSILVFGRIAPVKKIELAIDAVSALKAKNIDVNLNIVGDVLPQNKGYLEKLKDRVDALDVSDRVVFKSGVPFGSSAEVYQSNEVFLNFTPSGSFDKTVIEALACGTKVLVSNDSMKSILPDVSFTNGEVSDIAKKIQKLLSFDDREATEYSGEVGNIVVKHSLKNLVDKLTKCISQEMEGKK